MDFQINYEISYEFDKWQRLSEQTTFVYFLRLKTVILIITVSNFTFVNVYLAYDIIALIFYR